MFTAIMKNISVIGKNEKFPQIFQRRTLEIFLEQLRMMQKLQMLKIEKNLETFGEVIMELSQNFLSAIKNL